MARRKRSGRVVTTPTQRYVSAPIRNPDPYRFGPVKTIRHSPAIKVDRAIARMEDRRAHNPTRTVSPPRAVRRSDSRTVADPYNIRAVGFAVPARVSICAKRTERRRALFAFNVAGKSGVGRRKRRKTNFWSSVKC